MASQMVSLLIWVCVVSSGWCTMADFARGNFAVADYALLEDGPYVDDCVFAPEFMSNDYDRVTQLYCDGVVSRFLNFFFLGYTAPHAGP